MNKPELRILSDSNEILTELKKLSARQLNKFYGRRDAVLAARPDGTIIVYRPTQK